MHFQLFLLAILVYFAPQTASFRTWKCHDGRCVKEEVKQLKDAISIKECKVRCLKFGGLWPKPTGSFFLGNRSSEVDASAITFEKLPYPKGLSDLLAEAEKDFLNRVRRAEDGTDHGEADRDAVGVLRKVSIRPGIRNLDLLEFRTNADERYELAVTPAQSDSDAIKVRVEAETFFGLRHGLETLAQLFFYDDIRRVYKMVDEAKIEDGPAFTHRGIVVDTARSYVSVDDIMKLLDVMAMNKLNTFHWHITDSQSFPFVSRSHPRLSEEGAYSKGEVYGPGDVQRIRKRAAALGIRVVPELDAPAHVGEGWSALGQDLVTCFKWQPWRNFCAEPPCGQLDPTNDKVYDVLGDLIGEFLEAFPTDLFHMGGDEVNLNCWKTTPKIQQWMSKHNYPNTDDGYYRLWGEFHEKALGKLKRANDSHPHPNLRAILWTSSLTEPGHLGKYVTPEDYIIQIWTSKTDPTIRHLIEKKFRVVFSNYDELYFDCGGPSWVGRPGQNWCSPYIGWQHVYQHSPFGILRQQGIDATEETKKLVLGSEAAVWTEQIDGHGLHARLWPRAAALGERLWSNPEEDWTHAQFRMNNHRERLAVWAPAELLQPRWCYQNDGFCD